MRNKKKLIGLLSLCVCLISVCAVGCISQAPQSSTSSSSSSSSPEELEVTLNGFDVSPSIVVTPGTMVKIQTPLTTDEYGNVLKVSYSVKDKAGAPVELDLHRFFAMQDTYTVVYEVKNSAGELKTLTQKIYVMSGLKDEKMHLTDSDFDLSEYLPEEIPEGYEVRYDVKRMIPDGTYENVDVEIEENLLSVRNAPQGCYTINVQLVGRENTFSYHQTQVDLIENGTFVWNEVSSVKYALSYDNWNATPYQVEIEKKNLDGTEKEWFKVARTSENSSVRFTLLPVHSKAYYETYKGYGISLSFDYLYKYTGENTAEYKNRVSCNYTQYTEIAQNTLYTATIDLDRLLEVWDGLMIPPGSQSEETSFIRFVDKQSEPMTCWFGNFRLSEPPINLTPNTVIREGETLFDIQGKTSLEITSLLNEEEKAILNRYDTVRWELNRKGNKIPLSAMTLALNTLTPALYEVCAFVEEDVLLFKCNVDFYNSTSAPTWNVVSTENHGYLLGTKHGGGTKNAIGSVVQLDTAEKQGTYFQLATLDGKNMSMHYNVIGLHSKAYYEQFAQNYTLTFEYAVPGSQYYQAGFSSPTLRNSEAKVVWQTASVPMATVLAKWDLITGAAAPSKESDSMYYATDVSTTVAVRNAYLGNFQMIKN